MKRTLLIRRSLVQAALAAACAAALAPAGAASSASSASSESGSASVGSLSDSIQGSSNSSSGERRNTAGDYRITEVAALDQRPGDLRLTLQAVAGSGAEGEFYLWVPRVTVQRHELAAGTVVQMADRPYGVQFAAGTPQRAFFLAVDDHWLRELRTTAVAL